MRSPAVPGPFSLTLSEVHLGDAVCVPSWASVLTVQFNVSRVLWDFTVLKAFQGIRGVILLLAGSIFLRLWVERQLVPKIDVDFSSWIGGIFFCLVHLFSVPTCSPDVPHLAYCTHNQVCFSSSSVRSLYSMLYLVLPLHSLYRNPYVFENHSFSPPLLTYDFSIMLVHSI